MEKKQILVKVSDINDNPPTFPQSSYDVYVEENNLPGTLIFNISASDPDLNQNSRLSYSILETHKPSEDLVGRYFSINRENGTIYVLVPLDHEDIMEFRMVVQVRDGGIPPLVTNITVNVFVTDQNDNPPQVLYPRPNSSSLLSEVISPTVNPGYMVTKIVAWDADAGYNAWLSYLLLQATNAGLFTVGLHSGEISTARPLQEEDSHKQTLVILVKDNGEPALSSTVTLTLTISETSSRETLTDLTAVSTTPQTKKHLTFYLILAVILISVAFFITVVGVGIYKFYKWRQSKDIFKASRSTLYRTPGPFNHIDTVRGGFTPPNFYQQVLTTDSRQSDLLYKMPFVPSPMGSRQNTITRCDPALYNQIISTNSRLLVPSESNFLVNISDLNDNPPHFSQPAYQALVTENNAMGVPIISVSAFDPDLGQNSQLTYSLVEQTINGIPISSYIYVTENGTIYSGCSFDYEQTQQLAFQVQAKDSGSLPLSANVTVSIFIIDQNDNAPLVVYPVAQKGILAQQPVPFSAQEGYLVTKVTAVDADSGQNAWVSYKLQQATDQSLFKVSTYTGEIRTIRTVLEKDAPSQELVVEILDNGKPPLSATATLTLNLEHEHKPGLADLRKSSMEHPGLSHLTLHLIIALIAISALSALAFLFLVVKCLKRLRQRHSDVAWTSDVKGRNPMPLGGLFDTFPIHLSPKDKMEFPTAFIGEDVISRFPLRPGQTLLSERGNIMIAKPVTQQDISNTDTLLAGSLSQEPSENFYNSFLKENNPPGSLLYTVAASDPDEGDNSRLMYSVAGSQIQDAPISSFIYINPDNGNIYAQRSFDYETFQVLQIPVIVQDAGSPQLTSNVTVYLFILDQNDNAPMVLYPVTGRELSTLQRIPQSAPAGYIVTKVTAVDADSGHNAWLSYSLLPQSTDPSLFQVAPYSGEIRTLRDFQETDLPAQRLLVLVKDNGEPSLSTTVTILVSLEDTVSEERPQSHDFLIHPKEKSDLTLYLIIALVAVSIVSLVTFIVLSAKCFWNKKDRDSSCCSLSDASARGVFRQSSPKLQLNSDGTLKYMEVTLRPTDSQSQYYRANYSPGSDRSDFTFMRPVDYPQPSTLTREYDSFLSRTDTLNHPRQDWFIRCQRRTGDSSPSPGQELVEDPTTYISINPINGQIFAESPFDYEQTNHFQFQVEVCDGGSPPLCNRIMAHIYLLDQNDNAPWIRYPFTGKDAIVQFRIPRSTTAGALITKVMAVDLDSGRNAWLSYHLEQANDPSLFSMALRNGEVRMARAIQDQDDPTQELVLVVEDSGEPSMSTSVTVIVLLEESSPEAFLGLKALSVESEGPPALTIYLIISLAAISTISLIALVALGVRCLRREARAKSTGFGCCGSKASMLEDAPDHMLGHCHYQLSPGDAMIGVQVATSGPPARGYRSCFSPVSDISEFVFMKPNLTLRTASCSNLTEPSFCSKVRVFHAVPYLHLYSSPETPPPPCFALPHVEENISPGTLVLSLSASDPDIGVNSKLSYSIVDNGSHGLPISTYFHINQENGSIYTSRSLDYEQEKVFQVAVEVKDSGSPPLSSTATIHLFVVDQNDNAPVIVHPQVPKGAAFHQSVLLPVEPGYLVTKVVAVDADSGHNAWLSYNLPQETNEAIPFKVERHSGEIRVTRALREPGVSHRLVVEVKDNGVPSLSASLVLVISSEDNAVQDFSKSLDLLPKSPSRAPNLTLYLIVSLVAISLVSCVMLAVVGARCFRSGLCASGWFMSRCCSRRADQKSTISFSGRPHPEGFIRYLEVGAAGAQHYKSCLSPMSEQGDFLFVKPFSHSTTAESILAFEQAGSALQTPTDGQAQPNTDWRFSQAQRPGTSGSQNGDENGTWPNNQFDTEMLQAMILASANEAAAAAAANPDGNSTLGGGAAAAAGTMGLSTRYGPQFTLQHVPDYRQNVYIPGSTATLSNSSGKRDGKPAASGGGNKKKSGKKEKK
ncbi:hypothetical protein lerEdw1_005137 [Lerista edwardsae]|nr:hypothetical protein lerEdw1_005137 [Lerista edwardsae]